MKRHVLGAVALSAAVWAASAKAADLYGSRAPYTVNQPLNMYSWAGPYLGGNLGYGWGSVDNNPTKPSGFAGGVQAGYNWQQNGPWVFGVEGDIQASGAEQTFAPWKFSNPWFGTLRGRAGYALNNVLFYGTGGLRTARHHLRPVGIQYQSGLDARRRRRNGLCAELERQDRISLCRSEQQQLRHYRRVKWLPVRIGTSRRELSLLRTRKSS
jgi:opacity protein-like surface antigen